jgi:hypothetical protein
MMFLIVAPIQSNLVRIGVIKVPGRFRKRVRIRFPGEVGVDLGVRGRIRVRIKG